MQNPFVWHDLMTTDVDGAKVFYQKVIGWTFSAQHPGYHVAHAGDHGVGGIMEKPDHLKGMPPFWSGYVYSPDVEAACKQVVEYGGKVLRQPWDIEGAVRMAVIADPDGAVLNIMQPLSKEERTWPAEGAPGAVGWNELHAGNLDAAWDFYSKMFGWTKGRAFDLGPPAGVYQLFQIDGKNVGEMMKKTDDMPRPVWVYYFVVDGMEAAAQRIRDAGGKVATGPLGVGGQWVLHAFDPQGGHFRLLSNSK